VASGRLVEKEGWVRPGVGELRGMLGLGGDEGVEGLDEPGKELLDDLCQALHGASTEDEGDVELDVSGLTMEGLNEEVRYNKRDKWFAASINGVTKGDESIGEELRRCFDSLSGIPLHSRNE